jgi:hypothetical protein
MEIIESFKIQFIKVVGVGVTVPLIRFNFFGGSSTLILTIIVTAVEILSYNKFLRLHLDNII